MHLLIRLGMFSAVDRRGRRQACFECAGEEQSCRLPQPFASNSKLLRGSKHAVHAPLTDSRQQAAVSHTSTSYGLAFSDV
jgi:hypothetical protein